MAVIREPPQGLEIHTCVMGCRRNLGWPLTKFQVAPDETSGWILKRPSAAAPTLRAVRLIGGSSEDPGGAQTRRAR